MKKIRIISLFLSLFMLTGSVTTLSATELPEYYSELPVAKKRDTTTSPYWYNRMKVYTADQAQEKNIPFGCSGFVMELTGDSAVGVTVDFTPLEIPVSIVKALHMRVYYGTEQLELRISIDAGYSWVLRHEAKSPGQWEDVVVTEPSALKKLANEDGNLGVFGFGFRNQNDTRNSTVYVDSITAELVESDGEPPVIKYDGPTEITTTAGKKLVLPVTAYDEQEKLEFPLEYVWEPACLDENGLMTEGEYTLTLRATDHYGNSSEIKLHVKVGEKDVTPPVIHYSAEEINTCAGALPVLNFKVEDNCDDTIVTLEWSEDALDKRGTLLPGTHTLTVTAEDLTGNRTVKTIKVVAG